MEKEIWKDVVGYEGYYEVSNFGNVRSIDRYVNHSSGGERISKGKYLKQQILKGYKRVQLSKERKVKHHFVHRLVAFAFIPNPNNLPEINHIDEDKTNNNVENLEWCDTKYNINYGTRLQKCSKILTNRKDLSKYVLQYTLDGEFVNEYPSVSEAHRQTGIRINSISQCCNGHKRYTHAGGYKWCFKSETNHR